MYRPAARTVARSALVLPLAGAGVRFLSKFADAAKVARAHDKFKAQSNAGAAAVKPAAAAPTPAAPKLSTLTPDKVVAVSSGFGPRRVTPSRIPQSKRAKVETPQQDASFLQPNSAAATANANATTAAAAKPTPTPASTKLSPHELKAKYPFAPNLSSHQPSRIATNSPFVHDRWFLTAEQEARPAPAEPSSNMLEAYIATPAQLPELLKYLRRVGTVGIDTEFTSAFNYQPTLEVVQIATTEILAAVDVQLLRAEPAFKDLLEELLQKEWVLHSHRGDFEVMHHLATQLGLSRVIPRRVFDTQVAVAFLSPASSIGYAAMMSDLLQVRIDKSNTLSDWSRRPLATAQLKYALKDVEYLLPARRRLEALLKASTATQSALGATTTTTAPSTSDPTLGVRYTWFQEEMALLLNPTLYEPIEPSEAHVLARHRFERGTREFTIFAALAAWRETEAKRRNDMPSTIVRDDQLVAMSSMPPSTLDDIQNVINMRRRTVTEFGQVMLEVVRQARQAPIESAASLPDHRLTNRLRYELVSLLSAISETKARTIGMSSFLLAPSRDRGDLGSISIESIRRVASWSPNKLTTDSPLKLKVDAFLPSPLPASVNYRFSRTATEESMFARLLTKEQRQLLLVDEHTKDDKQVAAAVVEEATADDTAAAVAGDIAEPPVEDTSADVDADSLQYTQRTPTPLASEVEVSLLRFNKLLRGWRREIVGNELLQLIEGQRVLRWRDGALVHEMNTTTTTTTPAVAVASDAPVISKAAAKALAAEAKKRAAAEKKAQRELEKAEKAAAKAAAKLEAAQMKVQKKKKKPSAADKAAA